MSGNLSRSSIHKEYSDRLIAYHLGTVMRAFQDGTMDESLVENLDETHFLFGQGNRKCLAHTGTNIVGPYREFVAGTEGMTIALRLSGGANAKVEAPFFIFENARGSYPIPVCPDNVPGVSYRSQCSAWMDKVRLTAYLREPRVITPRPSG